MRLLKLTLLLTLISNSSFAIIRYVTPTGSGNQDGTSWTNAASGASLQAIINASTSGDEVWVSCGTYTTTSTANRNISFSMRNGVVIYGSFAGTENALSQRTLSCGPCSILSGEIGLSGNSDNSYHVVSNPIGLNNTATIDGFMVQDGNDERGATFTDGLGGGFYNNGGNSGNFCSPTIRNCVIRNNSAQFGAGIFNSGHTNGNSSPIITNCIITNNHAYTGGGGLDNFGLGGVASPTITNSLIYSNSAAQSGGGMFCWGGNNGNSNPTVVNSVFANNSATDGGGIISSIEDLPSGSFSGNSNPTILNSIFLGNTVSGIGPQFFLRGEGASFNATYSYINLTDQSTPHTITGSGTGNITTNPLLIDIDNAIGIDDCWMTSDDGLQLQSSSLLINSGNLTGAPTQDILGITRTGNPDIGAYEYSNSITTSIPNSKLNYFNIYPNPTSDELTVQFSDDLTHIIQIQDLKGKLVLSKVINKTEILNLSNLSKGIYIVQIDDRKSKKLIKK